MGSPVSKLTNGTEPIESEGSKRFGNTRQKALESIENKFVVVWIDPNVNDNDVIYRNAIVRLQRICTSINTFTNIDECVQFLFKT